MVCLASQQEDRLTRLIPQNLNRVAVVKTRDKRSAELAAACSARAWLDQATVLKQDMKAWVLSGESSVGPVVVKSMLLDQPADLLKRALGVTRLMRQWRGGELLARHGFAVARSLALWRGRDAQGRLVESLAMERHSGKTVLQYLAERDLPSVAEFALARALGSQAARLARAGLVNRDHKPSNLLVQPGDGNQGTVVVVLDTVAIRRARPRAALVHMLFELIVEPVGCRVKAPLGLRLALVRAAVKEFGWPRSEVPRLWSDVRARLAAHGDPTPKINPLADA